MCTRKAISANGIWLQPNPARTVMEYSYLAREVDRWNAPSTKAYMHGHEMCQGMSAKDILHQPRTAGVNSAVCTSVV